MTTDAAVMAEAGMLQERPAVDLLWIVASICFLVVFSLLVVLIIVFARYGLLSVNHIYFLEFFLHFIAICMTLTCLQMQMSVRPVDFFAGVGGFAFASQSVISLCIFFYHKPYVCQLLANLGQCLVCPMLCTVCECRRRMALMKCGQLEHTKMLFPATEMVPSHPTDPVDLRRLHYQTPGTTLYPSR